MFNHSSNKEIFCYVVEKTTHNVEWVQLTVKSARPLQFS
jgi:hypothetical protein